MNDCISGHIDSIVDIARCPNCKLSDWQLDKSILTCKNCESAYPIKGSSVDFLDLAKYNFKTEKERFVYERALENWGERLHKLERERPPVHFTPFEEYFGSKHDLYKGIFLDLGCGSGYDVRATASKYPNTTFFGIDLGANIEGASTRDNSILNLHYMRGDALNLPIMNEAIHSIISWGVFHHTTSPKKCFEEAYRILKKNGCICLYLYKNHEDNLLKYMGVQVEAGLKKIMDILPVWAGRWLCWLLSPILLVTLSWPAQILKRIKPLKKLGDSFPLHFSVTPWSLMGHLQDRLCASINHRFSKRELEALLIGSHFTNTELLTTTGGHFVYAEKK